MRSILVPLDGSSFAEQALRQATSISRGGGGRLRLVLVHTLPPAPIDPAAAKFFTSMELATRRSERRYLRGVQASLRAAGTPLSSAVTLTGKPGPALARHARELGVDLVVMATHGRGGVRRAWLGSVADYLIRTLQVPVLLVRPREGDPVPDPRPGEAQILVALDGSRDAEQALGPAVELARAWDAELVLLQVVRPVLPIADLPPPSSYDEDLTALDRRQAQDYLSGVAEQLRDRGLRATGAAVLGWHTADTILEAAAPDRIAAVAMTTRGRGGFRRLALGSVADKVVRGAEVPVLICRPVRRGRRFLKGGRR